jgi:hypothetical protein
MYTDIMLIFHSICFFVFFIDSKKKTTHKDEHCAQKHKTFKFYEEKKVLNLEISNLFGLFQTKKELKGTQILKSWHI